MLTRRYVALSTTLVFVAPLIAAAPPQDFGAPTHAEERAAIEAQARRMDRAFETKHMQVWNEVLTADFKGVTPGKTYNKAEFVAGGKAEADAALPPVSVDIRHVRLDVEGRRATGESRERTCYRVRGKDARTHRLCYRQRFTDEWRKEHQVWRLAEIRYSPDRSFRIDGRLTTRREMRKLLGR